MTSGSATINVGLIGCGRIAQAVHLGVLSRLPGICMAGLAEPDPERLAQVKRFSSGAAAFADYHDLLAISGLQAVVICVPTGLHAVVAIDALNAGKHVYLEKPMATDLADAGRVLDAWRKSSAHAMIGFNYQFHPLYIEARRLVQEGRVGEPVAVHSVFTSGRGELPAWKQKRQTGGGVLLDLGSHHFDLLSHLLGAPFRAVLADIRSVHSEDDFAAVTAHLENGVVAQSIFSLGARAEDRVEIYGREGKLLVDRLRSLRPEVSDDRAPITRLQRVRHSLAGVAGSPLLRDDLLSPSREPSYERILECFVGCLRDNRAPRPSLIDGWRSLASVVAAEESARTGRPVAVPQLADEDSAR